MRTDDVFFIPVPKAVERDEGGAHADAVASTAAIEIANTFIFCVVVELGYGYGYRYGVNG
jgi:hypothetical protein